MVYAVGSIPVYAIAIASAIASAVSSVLTRCKLALS